jgi:hypothetical protein
VAKTGLRAAVALGFFFLALSPLCAKGKGETAAENLPREERLTGRLFLTGSEPHAYLALETSGGVLYRLSGDAVKELTRNSQGGTAVLQGRVVREARGPGFPAEFLVSKVLEITR